MINRSYARALCACIIGITGSEFALAQSTMEQLPFEAVWERVEPSGTMEYSFSNDEGIVIRSPDLNRSPEGAFRDHLFHWVQQHSGQSGPLERRERAGEAIEMYMWNRLRSVNIESDGDSGFPATIITQGAKSGEEVHGAAGQMAKVVFGSNEFVEGNLEEKWRLLLREVQTTVLHPSVEITEEDIELGATPTILDVIRQATPLELGQLFDIGEWPEQDGENASVQVVGPGTPVPGNGSFSGTCRGRWCGSPSPGNIPVQGEGDEESENVGRALITYREDAYDHVVVLQPGKTPFDKSRERCTATLIAADWAVSALHCFGERGKDIRQTFNKGRSPVSGWRELTTTDMSIFAITLRREGETALAFPVERIFVPYFDLRNVNYQKGEVPERDFALIQIRGGEGTDLPGYPEFAEENESSVDKAVTFVGYGWTDVAKEDWTKSKDVAFNWLTESNAERVLWRTRNYGGNGGPCSGDSGGPIFLDFVRGFENEPHRMIGVVSGLHANGEINRASDCLDRVGEGEPVFSVAADICEIMQDTTTACQ